MYSPGVCQLELLAQVQGECDVGGVLHGGVGLGHPTCHVTGVVQICQGGGREAELWVGRVTHTALSVEHVTEGGRMSVTVFVNFWLISISLFQF